MDKINPVAVVGPAYCIAWVGAGPIAPIIQEHGIQIGDSLYSQHAIDTLQYRLDTANLYGLQCDKDISDLLTRAERAEAELEALRWVVEQYVTLQTDGGGRWRVEFGYTSPVTYGPWADSRMAAIDAAKQAAE